MKEWIDERNWSEWEYGTFISYYLSAKDILSSLKVEMRGDVNIYSNLKSRHRKSELKYTYDAQSVKKKTLIQIEATEIGLST